MIKINGANYNIDENDNLILDLVKAKHLRKAGNEYFWTKKVAKDQVKLRIRLRRYSNNSFWKFWYSLIEKLGFG